MNDRSAYISYILSAGAVLLFCSVFLPTLVAAKELARIALLIGNQAYADEVGPLKNPKNGVDLISKSLTMIGFKVRVLKDASYRQMDIAIRRHVDRVRRAGKGTISFVYYSGHGVANPETKQNYLVPVDVKNTNNSNIWYESFQQNEIISRLTKQAGNATHYVVFDACRDELKVTGQPSKSLGQNKGFVAVAEQSGILIAYATAPGETASDTGDKSGPYAEALAEEIVKPGIEAVTMFRNVQIQVKRRIGQDPWLNFPALPPVYLAGVERPLSASRGNETLASSPSFNQQAELAYWNSVRDSDDPVLLRTYLTQFPKGTFAPLAKLLAEKLEKRSQKKLLADIRAEQLRVARQKQAEAEAVKRAAELKQTKARHAEELKLARAEAEKARSALKKATKEKAEALQAAEVARIEKAKAEQEVKIAAVPKAADKKFGIRGTASDSSADMSTVNKTELARQLQRELKRLECYDSQIDGDWGTISKRAIAAVLGPHMRELAPSPEMLKQVQELKKSVCRRNSASVRQRKKDSRPEPQRNTTRKVSRQNAYNDRPRKNCVPLADCLGNCTLGGSLCPQTCNARAC